MYPPPGKEAGTGVVVSGHAVGASSSFVRSLGRAKNKGGGGGGRIRGGGVEQEQSG